MDEGLLLLLVGAILAGSIVVALGAARTGLPVLSAFLAIGMLLGSDGPGGIEFDDAELAREVGIIGLALILYEGGLQTSWRRLREVAVPAALLSTIGVVVSAVVTGVAAYMLFDLSRLESVLLGAVVSSTDAAAVFATLRFTHIRRKIAAHARGRVGRQRPDGDCAHARPDRLDRAAGRLRDRRTCSCSSSSSSASASIVGIGLGALAAWVFGRLPHSIGAFAPVASLAAAALAFGVADVVGGSGFLSVYLVGLAVGSTPSRYRRHLVSFHEGLAFAAQVALFIVLGLLVFPSDLLDVALPGLALAVLLILSRGRRRSGRRPRSTTSPPRPAPARLGRPSRRGADRARDLRPLLGRAEKETIFNAVFFVVVVSAIVQGTTLEWVAGRLGLLAPAPPVHEAPLEVGPLSKLELVDFAVASDHAVNGSAVRELGLPRTALIAVINRGEETIPPRGSTVVEAGDRLFVLIPRTMRADLEDVFSRWRRRV